MGGFNLTHGHSNYLFECILINAVHKMKLNPLAQSQGFENLHEGQTL